MKGTQAVTVLVLIKVGSKNETREINGISHFLEHMFFKGTKKRPNTLALIEPLDRVGGMYNAFTDKEQTGYWAKVDANNLDLALDWVSDIYLNSRLEEKEVQREKGVILQELKMYLDTPISYVKDLWDMVLYGNQPAGWPIIGEKENIAGFKRIDLLNYRKKNYLASNTVICIAGNIDSEATEKKIIKYFKKIKIGKAKEKLKVIEQQKTPQALIHFKKTDQTHICLGVRGYDLFHPLRYAQALLATILGGYMSSRLWISIRERKGLAYYIRTSSESTTDTGFLMTQAGVDHQKVESVTNLILKEYKRVKTKKITKSELQKAKDNFKGVFTLALESSDIQSAFYTGQELLIGKIVTPKEQISRINKVTSNDILKVAKDIFQSSKLNLALIGPFRQKTKFNKLLKL
jgi:predicted Zn-dependent peptidase